MTEITVRVYHRGFKGDTSSHVETHTIYDYALNWWKEHSGRGDFVLLSYRKW